MERSLAVQAAGKQWTRVFEVSTFSPKRLVVFTPLCVAALAILAWLLAGAGFYYVIGNCSDAACPWQFSHAFYYSVQTGLSIGFGVLSESKKASELYSCLHILAGSSFVGGALVFFISLMLTKQKSFLSSSEQRLLKACRALHTDTVHGLSLLEILQIMLLHPQYANDLIRITYSDPDQAAERIQTFATADESQRRRVAVKILRDACRTVKCFQQGSIDIEDLVEMDVDHASFRRKLRRWFSARQNLLRMSLAFLAWITLGAVFSSVFDGNDPITSIYFAIGALSTAGIHGTKTVASEAHFVFVGLFCIVGVPLYATMLGSFANVLIEGHIANTTTAKLNADLNEAETAFLTHLARTDGCEEVNLSEYTELQLLRLGLVDRATLQQIRDHFRSLDPYGRGRISAHDFLHAHHTQQGAGDVDDCGTASDAITRSSAPGRLQRKSAASNAPSDGCLDDAGWRRVQSAPDPDDGRGEREREEAVERSMPVPSPPLEPARGEAPAGGAAPAKKRASL